MKKIRPADNAANQKNPNPGSPGTNRQYDQAEGNKGKQKNPTWIPPAPRTKPA